MVAWLRDVLAQPNTMLRWTATEKLFVDCDRKDMDRDHMHRILKSGRWSVVFSQDLREAEDELALFETCCCWRYAREPEREPLAKKSPIFPFLAQFPSL